MKMSAETQSSGADLEKQNHRTRPAEENLEWPGGNSWARLRSGKHAHEEEFSDLEKTQGEKWRAQTRCKKSGSPLKSARLQTEPQRSLPSLPLLIIGIKI
jgi:hypothetical protein